MTLLFLALLWLPAAVSIALVDLRDARQRTKLRAWPRPARLYGGQAALGLAGGIIGNLILPGVGGLIGFALGSIIGGLLFPPSNPASPPLLGGNTLQNSAYGLPNPRIWGIVGIAGNVDWAANAVPTGSSSGGKGGGGGPSTTSWTRSFSVLFADRTGQKPINRFGRLWANGKPIVNADGTGKYASHFTYYLGSETQLPDPTIQADRGAANVSASRGWVKCVVADLPLADFGNAIPSLKAELDASSSTLVYNGQFLALTSAFADFSATFIDPAPGVDQYGNLIFTGGFAQNFNGVGPTGATLFSWSAATMVAAINAFVGSSLCGGMGAPVQFIAPVLNGQYLIAGGLDNSGASAFYWVVVLRPSATGAPTVLGVVRYACSAGGDGPSTTLSVAGAQTVDDPILFFAAAGGGRAKIQVLPSVGEITSGVYNLGYGAGFAAFEVPSCGFNVSGAIGLNLFQGPPLSQDQGERSGFALPAPDGSTDFYFYFNSAYLAAEVANGGPNSELATVLGPAHPGGVMIVINLGGLSFGSVAGPLGAGGYTNTAAYSIATGVFVDASATSVIPFADELHYITGGAAGGHDVYSMQPAIQWKNPDGSFLLAFCMAGISDQSANLGNASQKLAVRGFVYSPLTGVAVEFGSQSGTLFTNADLGVAGQIVDPVQYIWWDQSTGTFKVWGFCWNASNLIYLCQFGNASLAGDVGLDEIVGDLLSMCDLVAGTDYDVSALATQRVVGFVLNHDMTAKAAIDELARDFFFDLPEIDGKLVGRFRGGRAPDATVPQADLGSYSGDKPVPFMTDPRQKETELQQLIGIRFIDQALNYQINSQPGKRRKLSMHSRSRGTIDVPVVFNGTDGPATLVERMLYFMWIMRTTEKFTLPPTWLQVDVSDILELTFGDGGAFTVPCYVTKAEWGADYVITLEGANIGGSVFKPSTATGSSPIFTPGVSVEIEPSILFMLDLPLVRDQDDAPGYYLGARGADANWKGAQEYRSIDDVDFSTAIATTTVPLATGTALTVLASAPNTVFDRVNTVRVRMDAGATLASVTELDVCNGKNVAFLGGELIGFATATLAAPGVYDLSDLLRCIQGPLSAASGHAIGDRFELIANDGSVVSVAAQLSEFNSVRYFKAASFGTEVDAAAPVTFTPQFLRIKPLDPIEIAGTRDVSHNLTATWLPRVRVDANLRDAVDTMVDETIEDYQVDVIVGGSAVRTITKTASANGSVVTPSTHSALYEAADQTLDGITPGNPVSLKVYMMSTRVGRGFPGAATV